MKFWKLAVLIVIAIGLISMYIGCDLLGLTIAARIEAFESDLNELDRSDVYLNFHPDTTRTEDYLVITGDGTVFDNAFDYGYHDYTITIDQETPSGDIVDVVAIIDAAGGGFAGPWELYLTMSQNGLDWMIEELSMESYVPSPIVK